MRYPRKTKNSTFSLFKPKKEKIFFQNTQTVQTNKESRISLYKAFSIKLFFLFICQLCVIFIILIRLLFLQIFSFRKYKLLSDQNAYKFFFTNPTRGIIFDRNGIKLADNVLHKKLIFRPICQDTIHESITKIIPFLNNKPKNINAFIQNIKNIYRRNRNDDIVIVKKLSKQELVNISFYINDFPEFEIMEKQLRYYPHKETIFHALGYVAYQSAKKIAEMEAKNKIKINATDLYVGQDGIEKIYDQTLGGDFGITSYKINVRGAVVEKKIIKQDISGNDIYSSLDIKIQNFAHNYLQEHSYTGSVVVMDIHTGKIISIVSTPGIDPNKLLHEIDSTELNLLKQSDRGYFTNKAISKTYSPGSTFKIPAADLICRNGYDTRKIIHCTGEMKLGRRTIHCWKKGGHGAQNLSSAISNSCNIYFYNLAIQNLNVNNILKIDEELYEYDTDLFKMPNQHLGQFNKHEFDKKFKNSWRLGDTVNYAIGQGFNEKNTLQNAVMMSRLVSGKLIQPSLLEKNNIVIKDLGYKLHNVVGDAMYNLINDPKYSGYYYRSREFAIAGKTGSAQVVSRRIDWDDMKKGLVDEKLKNHAHFVGFGPYENPKLAIAVTIEHGIAGLTSGLHTGVRILEYALSHIE